jgi:AAHS family 4-hydroxybenzoate transporter-like MFS transporter
MPESIRFLVARNKERARIVRVLSRIVPDRDFADADEFTLSEDRITGLPFVELFARGRAMKTGLLWIAFFVTQMTVFFAGSWMTSILTEEGLSLREAITAASMFQAGGIVGPMAMGWLADHFRSNRVVYAFDLCAAVLIGAIGLAGAVLGAAMVACFVAGFFTFGALGGVIALAASVYPTAMRSTGLGWLSGVGRIGSLIGAVVGGLLLATGLPKDQLFYISALPPLIAACAVFTFGRVGRVGANIPADAETPPQNSGLSLSSSFQLSPE